MFFLSSNLDVYPCFPCSRLNLREPKIYSISLYYLLFFHRPNQLSLHLPTIRLSASLVPRDSLQEKRTRMQRTGQEKDPRVLFRILSESNRESRIPAKSDFKQRYRFLKFPRRGGADNTTDNGRIFQPNFYCKKHVARRSLALTDTNERSN